MSASVHDGAIDPATGPGTPFRSLRIERVDPVEVYIATAVGTGDPNVAAVWGAPIGSGVAGTRRHAVTKALAETLEREAAFAQPRAPLQYGTADEIDGSVRPAGFPALDAGRRLWWVGARRSVGPPRSPRSPRQTETDWLPLERVQLGCPSAVTTYCADTTGMAVHSDPAQAEARARLEVVERIGTRRLWRARVKALVGPEILVGEARELATSVQRAGFRVVCLVDRPLASVAVVAVLLVGSRDRAPALVCGSGSGRTLADAARHGLQEAFGQLAQGLEHAPLPEGAPLCSAFDHFRYYLDPRRARAMLRDWGVLDATHALDPSRLWRQCRPAADTAAFLRIDRGIASADALGLTIVQAFAPSLSSIDRVADRARGWVVPFG